MADLKNQPSSSDTAQLWAERRRNNVRLGWTFGAIAVALFLLALWKYRPM